MYALRCGRSTDVPCDTCTSPWRSTFAAEHKKQGKALRKSQAQVAELKQVRATPGPGVGGLHPPLGFVACARVSCRSQALHDAKASTHDRASEVNYVTRRLAAMLDSLQRHIASGYHAGPSFKARRLLAEAWDVSSCWAPNASSSVCCRHETVTRLPCPVLAPS